MAVTWQQYEYILIRHKDSNGWKNIKQVDMMYIDSGEGTPVIDYNDGNFFIVWRDFSSGDKNLKIRAYNPSGSGSLGMMGTVPRPTVIPNTQV